MWNEMPIVSRTIAQTCLILAVCSNIGAVALGSYGLYIQLISNEPFFSWIWNKSSEIQTITGWVIALIIIGHLLYKIMSVLTRK